MTLGQVLRNVGGTLQDRAERACPAAIREQQTSGNTKKKRKRKKKAYTYKAVKNSASGAAGIEVRSVHFWRCWQSKRLLHCWALDLVASPPGTSSPELVQAVRRLLWKPQTQVCAPSWGSQLGGLSGRGGGVGRGPVSTAA